MTIPIVEGEQKTGNYLKQGLAESGCVIDLARDGPHGMQLALTEDYEREKATEPEILRAADLELDVLRRRVTRAGRRIEFTVMDFARLEFLMRRRGEVLPRSLIAPQIWDMHFDSDTNVIEIAVRRLRAKVDDDIEPRLIVTVRGIGYFFAAPEST